MIGEWQESHDITSCLKWNNSLANHIESTEEAFKIIHIRSEDKFRATMCQWKNGRRHQSTSQPERKKNKNDAEWATRADSPHIRFKCNTRVLICFSTLPAFSHSMIVRCFQVTAETREKTSAAELSDFSEKLPEIC